MQDVDVCVCERDGFEVTCGPDSGGAGGAEVAVEVECWLRHGQNLVRDSNRDSPSGGNKIAGGIKIYFL